MLEASRRAPGQPLTRLLQAQTAQLKGDRVAAREIFKDMVEDPATRIAGLRGLYIEAEREGEGEAAHQIAERARRGGADGALGGARAAAPPDGGRRLGRGARHALRRDRRPHPRQAHGAAAARRHPHRQGARQGGRRARRRARRGAGGARSRLRPGAGRRRRRAAPRAAGRHPPRHAHPGSELEGEPASRDRRRLHACPRRRFGDRPAEAGGDAFPHALARRRGPPRGRPRGDRRARFCAGARSARRRS